MTECTLQDTPDELDHGEQANTWVFQAAKSIRNQEKTKKGVKLFFTTIFFS